MRPKRLLAALAVAVLCAPGTFVRTPMPEAMPRAIAVEQIAGSGATGNPAWRVAGVWRYSADHYYFGGFSALLALENGRLRAFSDRGARFTFAEPDRGAPTGMPPRVALQDVTTDFIDELWDIEAATGAAGDGPYWLAFESLHTVFRYTAANEPDRARVLENEVDWPANSGAEAMVRLADGRFVLLPEGGEEGLLFPSDPVEGAEAASFPFDRPVPGYAATDLAQLPDGRLLLLMRDTIFAMPPFDTLLAIGPAPRAGEPWAPEVVLDLDRTIPRENYEGLAVRELADGRVAVWIIADDNLSLMQRTLLAKLVFDPRTAAD